MLRVLFFAMAFALSAPAWALELVMVEQDGCFWCARWDRDVADIYPKTAEGQSAPLRRMDLHDDIPADLSFAAPLTFTPTFVLVDDGREVARIEGYPGEDFFWGLLARMLQDQAQPAKD